MAFGAIMGQTPPQQSVDAQDVNYSGTATGTNVKEALDNLKSVDDGLQETIDTLTTTVSGNARIVTGSYVGTGTVGQSNPNTLSFDTLPKAIIIGGESGAYSISTVLIDGETISTYTGPNATSAVTANGNKISWFGSTVSAQLNTSNESYYYVAFL